MTRRVCLGLRRRDREKVLHGRETGIVKRLPHGEFVEVHEQLSPAELFTLTQGEQPQPFQLGPATDSNGVTRRTGLAQRVRVRLSRAFYDEKSRV
ncbi:hypothetical protein [Streptomyces sp. AcH 505]|uniref:hypothetical protein n=1 Tax=Streptomyces sp. AcH 505 TaxID=352211 RepID=UPI0019D6FEDA